jgi:hypothetical protein
MSLYKGNNLISGHQVLYSTTGQNTDGAMTQKAVSDITDNTRFDGQWVSDYQQIASGISGTSTYSNDFDLSSYLPDDEYNYEVMLMAGGRTGTTSGNSIQIWVSSSLCPSTLIGYGVTRTASYVVAGGNIILPVGANRQVTLSLTSTSGTATNIFLQTKAYRRIGTNA